MKMEIKIDGKKVIRNGKELPLYEMNGKHYFLDSIELEKLELDYEAQPRTFDPAAANKIADSIEQKVLMQPLLTRYNKEKDTYLITEGQHRWKACILLNTTDRVKVEKIPCIIYVDMDKQLALQCGIEANKEDRARALSGGDFARKVNVTFQETREQISKITGKSPDEIYEREILQYLGHETPGKMREYILGNITHNVRMYPGAKIYDYLADRQDNKHPITVKNLSYFIRQLAKLDPLEPPKNEGIEIENLREDEVKNIVKVTNIFVEIVLDGKWNPSGENTPQHVHAKNICRRHPFEALGIFVAEILYHHGGGRVNLGAAYAPHEKIDWVGVKKDLEDLLNSHVWDRHDIRTCRSIKELELLISEIYRHERRGRE
jgi:ParB/RepB/Spo0J family partition protein